MVLEASIHKYTSSITCEQIAELEIKLAELKPLLENIGFEFCECPEVEIPILQILSGNQTLN